ncbi:MAG: undecaprenyldiphospho-muramoylpentapeptide beta-N-acetylglucosaminyltransferase [Candidatus Cloacimonadales bacterium]|nr:undecaprenyldiphospho-muramoylpentapeptide beta-N-acetylglucosaminyltransferase [Candidatus Cloacimonadales bacterium]
MKKVIIAAGGTGGHIIPAISIAKALERNGVEILYVGNRDSMEEKLATNAGFNFAGIDVQKFHRNFTWEHVKFPIKLLKSISDSKKIIRLFQPDAFIGTGGFVSGPVGYAAHKLKIPIFLQEQNSFPGATTRILSKSARKIFLGNQGAAKFLPKEKLIFSGNPINISVMEAKGKLDFEKLGLKENSIKVFLFGGSQGSLILNKNFLPIIDEILANDIEIIWQIGNFSYAEFYPKVKDKKGVFAFEYTSEMGKVLNSVDFVIARGGALSLAEIETKKLPSILIPLPSAAGNHQFFNAEELVEKNVAILLEQKYLTSASLLDNILLMKDKYKIMKKNFGDSHHLQAVQTIVNAVMRFLG